MLHRTLLKLIILVRNISVPSKAIFMICVVCLYFHNNSRLAESIVLKFVGKLSVGPGGRLKLLYFLDLARDFVEISHDTYRKLDELKFNMQPVKIIRRLDPFETQIERCE